MRFALISFFILAAVGLAAGLVGWYFIVERPRRDRATIERALREQRGSQTAEEFALLFENEAVRRIARELYPHLQLLTVTRTVPLRPSDLLFQELRVDDEDLVDAIDDALVKLGRSRPNRQEWKLAGCDKISTVDELVKASWWLLNPQHDKDRASDCR